jgi:hypothetical protein
LKNIERPKNRLESKAVNGQKISLIFFDSEIHISLFAKKKTEPAEKPAPTGKNGHINFSWEI